MRVLSDPRSGSAVVILIGILAAAGLTCSRADDAAARKFVKEAVADPKIFVLNPPADLRAYANLNPEELEKRMMAASEDGGILVLYPNGIPWNLKTHRQHLLYGPSKTWYADGTLQSDETYREDKLITGEYYSADGKPIAKITNGSGSQLEFHDALKGKVTVERETEYLNGLRHGRQITYAEGEPHRPVHEVHYRDGLRNGIETSWRPDGQLNSRTSYVDDKQSGETIYWHPNGLVQSLEEYTNGVPTGSSSRYYENGQKSQETIRDGQTILWEISWYPEGAMMTCQRFEANPQRTSEAVSFDRSGEKNGEVVAGRGTLVTMEAGFFERFFLESFQPNQPTARMPLPMLSWNSARQEHSTLILDLGTRDTTGFTEIESSIEAPGGSDTYQPISLKCQVGETIPNSVKIPLPSLAGQWTGNIYAQTKATGAAGTFQFVQVLYQVREKKPIAESPEESPSKPRPLDFLGKRFESALQIGKLSLPPLDESLSGWATDIKQWALYSEPAVLISRSSTDIYQNPADEPWELVKEFDFRPRALVLLTEDHLLVWGSKETSTPEKGIPYIVLESRDGGKKWTDFHIPEVSYLTQIMPLEEVLVVTGVRLPNEGLPPDKDWFELPKTAFVSSDLGEHFTEHIGPSFLLMETVVAKTIAPDGQRRAFLSDSSFLDTSMAIWYAAGPNELPRRILHTGQKCDVVWSKNSEIVALSHNGKLYAFYDLRTGKSEVHDSPKERDLSAKEMEKLVETDRAIRTLLEAAK